jgi:hypothetical protein
VVARFSNLSKARRCRRSRYCNNAAPGNTCRQPRGDCLPAGRWRPRPVDGERQAAILDIHKQGAAIRRKTGASQFGFGVGIVRHRVLRAVRAYAHEAAVIGSVLADQQVAPWRDGDVVGVPQQALVIGFRQQAQPPRRFTLADGTLERTCAVFEYLAESMRTANGAGYKHGTVRNTKPFAAGETCRTAGETAQSQVVGIAVDVLEIDPLRWQPDLSTHDRRLRPVARIE